MREFVEIVSLDCFSYDPLIERTHEYTFRLFLDFELCFLLFECFDIITFPCKYILKSKSLRLESDFLETINIRIIFFLSYICKDNSLFVENTLFERLLEFK